MVRTWLRMWLAFAITQSRWFTACGEVELATKYQAMKEELERLYNECAKGVRNG